MNQNWYSHRDMEGYG